MALAPSAPEKVSANRSEQTLIFIVEDEPEIASLIALRLGNSGFASEVFHDGNSVIEALRAHSPALILLDRMLPDMDGLEVLRYIVKDAYLRSIKTIVVSARDSETDKVRALEMGADDYISKPFSPRELVARVRAVLRTGHKDLTHRVMQRGNLLADLHSRRLLINGKEFECSVTEFDLLTYFMRHSGRTLSRRHLLETLWPGNWQTLDARVVDVYVHRLRRKIEPDPTRPVHLVTHRGDGYALVFPDVVPDR